MKAIKYKNNLAEARRARGLHQKQVAYLLGQKTKNQISKYEVGDGLPSLERAIMLSIIYQAPLRLLFSAYFDKCRQLVSDRAGVLSKKDGIDVSVEVDYCSWEERLNQVLVTEPEMNKIRAHTADLVRRRAERLGHLT